MSRERELLRRISSHSGSIIPTQFIYEIQKLLAQPEQVQEPVAWMYERQTGDFTERTLSVGFEKDFDGITIPLYTSPPEREPLSDEDIRNFADVEYIVCNAAFIAGVKFAEKAHGIGVDDE